MLIIIVKFLVSVVYKQYIILNIFHFLLNIIKMIALFFRKFSKSISENISKGVKSILLFTVYCSLFTACTGSSDAFLDKAKEQLQKGKAKEAVEYLNQAIDKDPENAKAFNMRGAANFELKDYASALLDYEQAIKLEPKDYKPYFNRASVKMEKSDWEGALVDCNKASEIQPDTAEIYIKRGIVYAALIKIPEALNDFEKAIKLNPKEVNALYNRGNIYFQTGDLENATKDFVQAVQIDPQFAKAFYALGITQQKSGKADEACMSLKTANRLGYSDARVALDSFCK
ncbi:MAG: tetratricopeptide repeat protein [Bacteroidota bacterium]